MDLGHAAEALVARRLEESGFAIRARNVRVGRTEIDIVAQSRRLLVFCEVRSRTSTACGEPWETIGAAKLGRIRRAAGRYLREARARGELRWIRAVRIDIASVVYDTTPPRISYFTNVTAWSGC